MRTFLRKTGGVSLALGLFGTVALGQSFQVDWYTIDGGGGTSAAGPFAVSGTIGQPDAGGPMTGGQFSVTGGFWALPGVVQTPDAPTLYITNDAPGFATLWWVPPTPGFLLQSTDSLDPTNWVNAPSGSSNPITIPVAGAPRFYRVWRP